jgi:DNA (cytosine-5)-methyltransferase 1
VILDHELVVDLFAGGGGASEGIRAALGRDPDIAVNHSAVALAMHEANHPTTRHYREDVFDVNPARVCGDRPVGLLWLSPDCTHFSKAKGGKPKSKKIRSLAWVAVRWAAEARPRVIVLENVEEFVTWGPLHDDGQPIAARVGETFREWLGALHALGYRTEHRLLVAADHGAPTTRKRFFLIARCDGAPIVWPEPTHGRGRAHAWRTAAEIIDWSIPCPSIFTRKRPLAEATQRRIALGLKRYVLDCARPFIVPVTHPRDARVHSIDEPVRTVTAAHRGEFAVVGPTLIQTGYGERPGQTPRVPGLEKPLGTVVAGGAKHALVAPFVTKHYGGVVGHDVARPLGTVTTRDHHAVSAGFLTKFYGTSTGSPLDAPAPTVTASAGGGHLGAVRAFLERWCEPTLHDPQRLGLVHIDGEVYQLVDVGMRMLTPRELFRAQGFCDDYVIDPLIEGERLTKEQQTSCAGNSVPPPLVAAIVAANLPRRVEVAT